MLLLKTFANLNRTTTSALSTAWMTISMCCHLNCYCNFLIRIASSRAQGKPHTERCGKGCSRCRTDQDVQWAFIGVGIGVVICHLIVGLDPRFDLWIEIWSVETVNSGFSCHAS